MEIRWANPASCTTGLMITARESGGGVEHLLPPHALAAPLHRHTREDSYVLEGRVGALLGEEEGFGDVGYFIFKPRGQWHTFWNVGDVPARILEIISPGGFEEAFRELAVFGDELTPETMAGIANRYGVAADFEATMPIIERHQPVFG